jgi:hypothetical protein
MGVKLSDLITRRVIVIPVQLLDGVTVQIGFRPDRYTREVEAGIAEANREQRFAAGHAALTAALVCEWDLVDDDGTPLPVTPEHVAALGMWHCKTINEAIARRMNETETKKG